MNRSKKTYFVILSKLCGLALLLLIISVGCKKDETTNPESKNKNVVGIMIEQGGRSLSPGGTMTYTAKGVDANGNAVSVSDVSWSSSKTGVAEVSASGVLTVKGVGISTIKATITADGKTLTAEAPLKIAIEESFSVAPWAVVGTTGFELDFIPVYLSPSAPPSYSYETSNASVATVTAGGHLKLVGGGECVIKVTAQTNGNPVYEVPVVVVGAPFAGVTAPPVTKVTITPGNKELLPNQTFKFTARAFNANNQEVSETPTWSSTDPNIFTVENDGTVTARKVGQAAVRATVKGVSGEAQVQVFPDTVVIVTPFYTSVAQGGSATFNAKVYKVTSIDPVVMPEITSHAPLKWFMPTYGVPGFDMFNIGTVTTSGNLNTTATLKVKQDAMAGLASFLLAQVGDSQDAVGAATVVVGIGGGEDCGTGNPAVNQIQILNGSSVNLSLFGQPSHQIQFKVLDGNGNEISAEDANLKFNTSNQLIAAVDGDGNVTAAGFGSATITICSGNFASATVTINVAQ